MVEIEHEGTLFTIIHTAHRLYTRAVKKNSFVVVNIVLTAAIPSLILREVIRSR